MKEEKHKDLLKAAEDAEQNGMGGAHTDTLLCSDRFNVFVLQKFFFFICLHRLSKYTCSERKSGYNPNYFVVQKHEYIQPSTPHHTFSLPRPPIKKRRKRK